MPAKKNDKQIVNKIERYCAYQERCRKEVSMRMKQLGIEEESVSKKILKQLEKGGFLNEARYAKAFARDKFNLNHWGKVKISLALREKNIPQKFIDDGLKEINSAEYKSMLKTLLRKKESELRGIENPFLKKNRLANYLAGRGFEADFIWDEIGRE